MNLSGIGRIMIESMKEDGLKVKVLTADKYIKTRLSVLDTTEEGKEDIKSWNGFYLHNKDCIYVNSDSLATPEYLLLHEATHAVRANPKRTMRLFEEATLHQTMKSIIKKTAKKLDNSSAISTIFFNKAKTDVQYWREEAIADCISLFMCVEYGTKTKRSSIETMRATFVPFAFKDIFNDAERKRFLSKVRKECIYTLGFIIDNYTNGLFDKKLVCNKFIEFFEKEILYCYKYIAKAEEQKLKLSRARVDLSLIVAGKQLYK